MKAKAFLLAGLLAAGCDYIPGIPGVAPTDVTMRRGEFIALVEANGCRLDQSDNAAVLVPAGFSDAEAGQLGGLLLSEGVAEIADDGDLILLTETCV